MDKGPLAFKIIAARSADTSLNETAQNLIAYTKSGHLDVALIILTLVLASTFSCLFYTRTFVLCDSPEHLKSMMKIVPQILSLLRKVILYLSLLSPIFQTLIKSKTTHLA